MEPRSDFLFSQPYVVLRVMFRAQPTNLKGLGVVVVMSVGFLAAAFARLPNQPSVQNGGANQYVRGPFFRIGFSVSTNGLCFFPDECTPLCSLTMGLDAMPLSFSQNPI